MQHAIATVESANISKYNDRQVRIKANGQWFTSWDMSHLQMVGKTVSMEYEVVQKGDKTYYNVRSMWAEEAPAQAAPAAAQAAPAPAQAVPDDAPFYSVRSMEILYQTCLKEACISLVNDTWDPDRIARRTVGLARSLLSAINGTTDEDHYAEQQKQHAAAQAEDDSIPF